MERQKAILTVEKTPGKTFEITKYILGQFGRQVDVPADIEMSQPYYFSGCAIYVRDSDSGDKVQVTLLKTIEEGDPLELSLNDAVEKIQGRFPDLKFHRFYRNPGKI